MRVRLPNGLLDVRAATSILTAGLVAPDADTANGYIRIRGERVGEPATILGTFLASQTSVSVPLDEPGRFLLSAHRVSVDLLEDGSLHVETLVEIDEDALALRLPAIVELQAATQDETLIVTFRVELREGQSAPDTIELATSADADVTPDNPAASISYAGTGDYQVSISAAGVAALAVRCVRGVTAGPAATIILDTPAPEPVAPTLLTETAL